MSITPIYSHWETDVSCDECKNIDALAKGAGNVIYHNFKWQFATLVLMNSTVLCGVSAFMKSYGKNIIFVNELSSPMFYETMSQFVLFGYDLDNIVTMLQWIEKYNFDNTGNFLIICQSDERYQCDETEAVKILWGFRVVNVIFVNLSHHGTGYAYNFEENCKPGPPIKLENWGTCFQSGKNCYDYFPMKLQNFHECPILVSTFIQQPYMVLNNGVPSGADGDLLRILIEALNATLVLKTPWKGDGWGNLDENGSWVGSLGDLYYNLADFSMTSASITETRYKEFQMSTFYYHLTVVWVTHPSVEEEPTFKLMRPFRTDSRAALLVFFILFLLLVLIVKTNFCTSLLMVMKIFVSKSILFHSVEICMGQPVALQTKKTSVLSLILIWVVFCFLIRTFYQVHLINSLKTDVYMSNFVTIKDAIREEYDFGGGLALRDYYVEQPEIFDNWKDVNSTDYLNIMNNLTKGTKFVLAMNVASTKYFIKKTGKKLHILPKKIVTSPTILFFKKFSPLVLPINQILSRLVEFGIPQMLYENSTSTLLKTESSNNYKPIKLKECAGCFEILCIGWLLSFVILIVEMLIKKCKSIKLCHKH